MVKLIVNIKTIRNLFYFLKINNQLRNYKFIFFCYNINLDSELRTKLINNNIRYFYLKKIKCQRYLQFLIPYLTNSLILFCCNTEKELLYLLPYINKNILLSKINNNYYSINNLLSYINSKKEFVDYCTTYYWNLISIFFVYQHTLNNK